MGRVARTVVTLRPPGKWIGSYLITRRILLLDWGEREWRGFEERSLGMFHSCRVACLNVNILDAPIKGPCRDTYPGVRYRAMRLCEDDPLGEFDAAHFDGAWERVPPSQEILFDCFDMLPGLLVFRMVDAITSSISEHRIH